MKTVHLRQRVVGGEAARRLLASIHGGAAHTFELTAAHVPRAIELP